MSSARVGTFKLIASIAVIGLAGIGLFALLYLFTIGRPGRWDQGIPVQNDEDKSNQHPVSVRFSIPQPVFGTRYSLSHVLLVDPDARSGFKQIGSYSSSSSDEYGTTINVVFSNYAKDEHKLIFATPALVSSIDFPSTEAESLQTSIIYEAYTHDSNKDGIIGGEDNLVLFSSGLDGGDLTQVTPDSLSVVRWVFAETFYRLIISIKVRPSDSAIDEQLWKRQILWYDLSSKSLYSYKTMEKLLELSKEILKK